MKRLIVLSAAALLLSVPAAASAQPHGGHGARGHGGGHAGPSLRIAPYSHGGRYAYRDPYRARGYPDPYWNSGYGYEGPYGYGYDPYGPRYGARAGYGSPRYRHRSGRHGRRHRDH